MSSISDFEEYRDKMNNRIFESDSLILKRFFNLDSKAFHPGHLDQKTKELTGLGISLAMRCDDCVKYHIGAAIDAGVKKEEIIEIFEIATLIGGTIVIPHLRRAFEFLDAKLDPTN